MIPTKLHRGIYHGEDVFGLHIGNDRMDGERLVLVRAKSAAYYFLIPDRVDLQRDSIWLTRFVYCANFHQ
jgi:hypothetical protein